MHQIAALECVCRPVVCLTVSSRVCVVQRSPRRMLTPLMAALLELCENPQAVAQLLHWSGERDATAPQLLLHIWRTEEERMGVTRDPHGVIAGSDAFNLPQ